jgi:hypothetical protein
MTQIKYATIAHGQGTDQLIICREKKTGQVGYLPANDADNPIGIPLHSEVVVELPETLTPTEFDEYVDDKLGQQVGEPITAAMLEVAEEKGIEYESWDWPIFTDAKENRDE